MAQGVDSWNKWRKVNKEIRPDLRGADLTNFQELSGINLKEARMREVNLSGCNLTDAHLDNAYLRRANLSGANLTKAGMAGANLRHALLPNANLTLAYLRRADLSYADLSHATLNKSVLEYARLVDTILEGATLEHSLIYGASVWNVKGTPKDQSNLVITPQIAKRQLINSSTDAIVTVDDLEVAQLIHLILNNQKLRNVIGTLTSKTVLILGRFTPERKAVLKTMADALREHNLLPIIFDFEGVTSKTFTETIKILAGLSLFVIADITDASSVPLELQAIVPDYRIPFVPIIEEVQVPPSLISDLYMYSWFLPIMTYATPVELKKYFDKGVVERAWQKHQELEVERSRKISTISIADFAK